MPCSFFVIFLGLSFFWGFSGWVAFRLFGFCGFCAGLCGLLRGFSCRTRLEKGRLGGSEGGAFTQKVEHGGAFGAEALPASAQTLPIHDENTMIPSFLFCFAHNHHSHP